MEKYEDPQSSKGDSSPENLLERVLSDVRPLVPSSVGAEYDLKARPTELSSGGYIDSPGT